MTPDIITTLRTRNASTLALEAANEIEQLRLAVAAERERCAKIAEEHATRNYPWGSENADIYHAQAACAERIAMLIRRENGHL